MPASNFLHIPTVIHFVWALKPRSVLDVGVGNGAYGLLLRQYLDIGEQRIKPSEWKLRIDGVDVFEGYRNPVWDFAYNNIYMGDIRHIHQQLSQYDIVMFNDVLEHLEKDEAVALVLAMVNRSSVVIATTPNRVYPQGAWGGNDAETHRCLLSDADFPNLVAKKVTGDTTCYVCCSNKALLEQINHASLHCPTYIPSRLTLPRRIKRKVLHLANRWRDS